MTVTTENRSVRRISGNCGDDSVSAILQLKGVLLCFFSCPDVFLMLHQCDDKRTLTTS